MLTVKIKPISISIEGWWQYGVSLDLHTSSSTAIGAGESGRMQFDTVRTEIAELLYRLKCGKDRAAADPITATAAQSPARPARHRNKFDSIVPVPPSELRELHPVMILAKGIGAALGVEILTCIMTTRPTAQLRKVKDPAEAQEAGREPFQGRCGTDAWPQHLALRRSVSVGDHFERHHGRVAWPRAQARCLRPCPHHHQNTQAGIEHGFHRRFAPRFQASLGDREAARQCCSKRLPRHHW